MKRFYRNFLTSTLCMFKLSDNTPSVIHSLTVITSKKIQVPSTHKVSFSVLNPVFMVLLGDHGFIHFRRVKKEKLRFDAVIGQWYFTPFVCGMARYLAYPGPAPPLISLSTTAKNLYNEEAAGSLPHPSFVPYETPYTDRMSIWQKIHNWVIAQVLLPRWKYILDESARRFFQETYGQEFASVVDGCWGNVSLMLNTGNFLHSYPRPLAPNVIEIGPLHIRKPKVLPKVRKSVIYEEVSNWPRCGHISDRCFAL